MDLKWNHDSFSCTMAHWNIAFLLEEVKTNRIKLLISQNNCGQHGLHYS